MEGSEDNMRLFNLILPLLLISALGFHDNQSSVDENNLITKKSLESNQNITVKHKVVNGDVYIECFVPNFSFTQKGQNSKKNGEGHLLLYINGSKVDEIYRAAFIVKDLPAGKHKIKVEVVHNDSSPYNGLKKELEIEIS
jgi:hypothetical protein